jgi:Leucine-rich repeat (LRR) protein
MIITIREITEYDTNVHPEVTVIRFKRHILGNFFKDNRFPILVKLDCGCNQLKNLKVNCPSLQELYCYNNQLTTLELDCPSLQRLWCNNNKLSTLELICPSLKILWCKNDQLTNLNGLEFCENLSHLICSKGLSASVKILKTHLPKLKDITKN